MQKLLLIVIASLLASTGLSDDMPPEVERLKMLRDMKVAKQIKEIDAVYYKDLDRLKNKYVTQKNYRAAAYVEEMQIKLIDLKAIEESGSTGKPNGKENQNASIYYKGEMRIFKNGAPANPDRHHVSTSDVPEKYSEWKFSFNLSKDPKEKPLTFKVKKAGIVTLAIYEPHMHVFLKDGWKKTDIYCQVAKGKKYHQAIMEKNLEEGVYEFKSVRGVLPVLLTQK